MTTARDLILERFPSLSPRLRAAARFIVDHPNEVVIGSMRALAERSGAQPATFVRLAQQLGYAGWPELKSAFAADLGLQGERYVERARQLASKGKGSDPVRELFAQQQQNLERTHANNAPLLRKAAKLLAQAPCVHIAGFRASFPIAYALFYGYRLLRNEVQLMDGQGGGLDAQLRAVGRGDVVVIASFAPYSREALQVLQHALAVKARTIALTDSDASPLALQSGLALRFGVQSPSFFPSVAAGVALVEALLEQLVLDGGDAVIQRLDEVEQQLRRSGTYVDGVDAAAHETNVAARA